MARSDVIAPGGGAGRASPGVVHQLSDLGPPAQRTEEAAPHPHDEPVEAPFVAGDERGEPIHQWRGDAGVPVHEPLGEGDRGEGAGLVGRVAALRRQERLELGPRPVRA
ncbi:MAG: hypothetical protein QF860_10785, partial [Planctomycetota bacterium]|nr:hypothetical protein [Planctomycetota bacterium]